LQELDGKKITTFSNQKKSFLDILQKNSFQSWVRLIAVKDRQKLDGSSQHKNTFHYLSHIGLEPLEHKKEV
jgi:hypothetical protein